MTDQIRQYQLELQSYIGAMTWGQEEERRRLARELHDETVQDMIALNQRIEMVERELTRDPQRAAARLRELRPLVTGTIDALRRQIHALRPLYLEDLGFVPALEMLVHQIGQRHELASDFTVTGNIDARPCFLSKSARFASPEEALQNVVKHAQATRVDVNLHLGTTSLILSITDDGCGFAVPEWPYHLAQEGHFGLLGIKERTQLHMGVLEIKSQMGQGTTVSVRLPLYDLPASSEPIPPPTQLQP